MLRASRFAVAGLLVALLAACGFQLQGSAPLPKVLAVAYIDADNPQSEFVQSLRRALQTSGARVTERREDGAAVLRIETDKVTERIISVSARNIPQEYELVYDVAFSVSRDGKELLASQQISANRDYSFDERALLAKEREKETLSEALARDLAALAMRRLSVL
jgi:LPS-assembly lipoprotein